MPDSTEPSSATPTPDPTPKPVEAPASAPAAVPAKGSKGLGLTLGVAALLLALPVIPLGIYALHPYLIAYRGALPYVTVLLGGLALALAYKGARFRHPGERKEMEPGLGKDPLLWAALVLVVIGGLSYAFQLNRRGGFERTLEMADPNMRAALGTHFIIAYPGENVAYQLIQMRAVAGFFFDQRHVKDLSLVELEVITRMLQREAREVGLPPLLLCTDQEGGLVDKLSPPLTSGPGLASVVGGDPQDLEQVRQRARDYGVKVGKELRGVGINMNLAPIADLKPPGAIAGDKHTHLDQRAVSADPAVTKAAVAGYVEGLQSTGVRAVIKHFPGLGGVTVDTHVKTGEISKSVAELRESDWKPFLETAKSIEPRPAVMLGHVSVPELDPVRLVSYSPRAVDLFKQEAPNTVTITDCFAMGPIWSGPGGVGAATVQALESGVTFILFAWDGEAYYDGIGQTIKQVQLGLMDSTALGDSTQLAFEYRLKTFLNDEDVPAAEGAATTEATAAISVTEGTPNATPAEAAIETAQNPNPVEEAPQPGAPVTPPAEFPPSEVGDVQNPSLPVPEQPAFQAPENSVPGELPAVPAPGEAVPAPAP